VWSEIELVKTTTEIRHPSARACLEFLNVRDVEVHYDGDLPGRSGLGSSSSFTVALLHALHALQGKMVSKKTLAGQAIYVEQTLLGEVVGSQDQTAAAYGGVNRIDFDCAGVKVQPVTMSREAVAELEGHMTLFFVGQPRAASAVAAAQVAGIGDRLGELAEMKQMVAAGVQFLDQRDWRWFGRTLHAGWELKKRMSDRITNSAIDDAYKTARRVGAWGGKLLGAGSGGFLLVFRPPEAGPSVSAALSPLLEVGFKLDFRGSEIVHYS